MSLNDHFRLSNIRVCFIYDLQIVAFLHLFIYITRFETNYSVPPAPYEVFRMY